MGRIERAELRRDRAAAGASSAAEPVLAAAACGRGDALAEGAGLAMPVPLPCTAAGSTATAATSAATACFGDRNAAIRRDGQNGKAKRGRDKQREPRTGCDDVAYDLASWLRMERGETSHS